MREIKFKSYVREKDGIKSYIWEPFNRDMTEADDALNGELLAYGLQFTGLKDKHGKDIYESDIVRLIEPNRIYTVEYLEFTYKLVHADPKLDRMHWGSIQRITELGWSVEVIGNIFEHSHFIVIKDFVNFHENP